MKFTSALKNKGASQATLSVAVRARPVSNRERLGGARTITKTVDKKCMVVMDPDDPDAGFNGAFLLKRKKSKSVAGGARKLERRYVFDGAFDGEASNEEVYDGTAKSLVSGVLRGINATVFAYGATGSGKTHTMVGNPDDPGLMVLSLRDVFRGIHRVKRDNSSDFEVSCSYTEVYNELVYDLLVPIAESKPLELREDPEKGPTVSNLTHVAVGDESEIFALLKEGNARRKTEETGANATSSRSHAVLEIWVTRSEKNHYNRAFTTAKLTLVDLAGAERASETNNRGQQLRDGANINKSLLSLANCINALGKRRKKGFAFVPFRDSKLTRILKDGLCGNSKTVMVATVSGSSSQYEHTVNTLKYADRAKEIKTFVQENRGTVETHVAEYQRVIDALREERRALKAEVERLKCGPEEGLERETSDSPSAEREAPDSSRPRSSRSNPIADVNELLLAAAAALPEGDELRVEAEALAARARRAAAAGYGKRADDGIDSEGERERETRRRASFDGDDDVFSGLRHATRVLDETMRLGRMRSSSAASDEGSEKDSEVSGSPSSRSSRSSGGTLEAPLDDADGGGRNGAALTPVPEREASNRANATRGRLGNPRPEAGRVAALAKDKKQKGSRGSGLDPENSRNAFLAWESSAAAEVAQPRSRWKTNAAARVESETGLKKPSIESSPYARSVLGGKQGAKPRSAALQRRLSKIGRG